jgi:hypothetical protein
MFAHLEHNNSKKHFIESRMKGDIKWKEKQLI